MKFKRKIYNILSQWRTKANRKPLILRGARQVGKSTVVQQFSKEYQNSIMLNLEKPDDAAVFRDLERTKDIVELILYRGGFDSKTKEILLFIDEIQEVPQAIKHLRYFYEEYPNLHVIAAGSLLEFALKEVESFPVGRVEQVVMHPFDFEEFAWAKGDEKITALLDTFPIPEFAHQPLLQLFKEYVIVGGMPEAVKNYVHSKSITELPSIYQNLWLAYKDDVEKYANNANERKIINHILNTSIYEKDRITFANFGNSNYRSREVGEALNKLSKARVLDLIYPTTNNLLPLAPDFKRKPRLQFLDTGLLNYLSGWQEQLIGFDDLMGFHSGKVIQHLVIQEHIAQHNSPLFKPLFWVRENANSNAEVDMLISSKGHVFPVEVKAGAQGRLRSLHQYIDRTDLPIAIRVLQNKLSIEKVKTPSGTPYTLLNLPVYLTSRLKQYAAWLIEVQG